MHKTIIDYQDGKKVIVSRMYGKKCLDQRELKPGTTLILMEIESKKKKKKSKK